MLKRKYAKWFKALAAGAGLAAAGPATAAPPPDVVLIVADDLGFSDLGAFGGEIATPNLDALAKSGLQLTNFHAAPTCSPTRSMLLTGTDNHTAGVGAMAEASPPALRAHYGYEGQLTQRVATLAERLQAAGYATVMAGKWHLGMTSDSVPAARGFDKSFALLQGGHNHFGKGGFGAAGDGPLGAVYQSDGQVAAVPDDFYSSDYFTTQLLNKIAMAKPGQPVFAYLAFTAPHAPLQAPKDLIEKYQGRYDSGWVELRRQRLQRMQALDLIAADPAPHELVPDAQAWDKLSNDERRIESRKMEIYAAMVDRLDWNVGRLIEQLKRDGRYDNTVFVFMSDNGPAGETAETFGRVPGALDYIHSFDNSLATLGSASSFVFYGQYWAQAGSAPYALYKSYVTEGGTRVPALVVAPNIKPRRLGDAYANVMDIVPTVLELTGAGAAAEVGGRAVAPIRGRTLVPYLSGRSPTVYPKDEAIALELHGQRSVTRGQWKLTYIPQQWKGSGSWQLFDLARDPAERTDVGDAHPDVRQALIEAWDGYARSVQVVMPEALAPAKAK